MTITLTDENKVKFQSFAPQLLKEGVCSVRTLAKFIVQAVASFHGVMYGPLWYRALEKDKMQGLRQGNGVYDSLVLLSEEAKTELQWWKDNILSSYGLIYVSHGKPDFVLFSDTSLTGWGCSSEHGRTGGHWNSTEVAVSINALELNAGLFASQVFASDKCSLHVRLMMDNTTAVACVNKMGTSHSDPCHGIPKQILEFYIAGNLWISAAYVLGVKNSCRREV